MQTAMRLSGVSVLLADMALVAGMIVSVVYGLGIEALPLTSPQGLQHLGRSAEWYTLRETLWLAYPIFVLPQGIALYSLLRDHAPGLLWPLVLWCVGLTLGIGVDVATVGVARGFGVMYLAAGAETRPLIESAGRTIAHATLLAQFVCDNVSGTLVYPLLCGRRLPRAFHLTRSGAHRYYFLNSGVRIVPRDEPDTWGRDDSQRGLRTWRLWTDLVGREHCHKTPARSARRWRAYRAHLARMRAG